MTVYARSDVASVSISRGHGGCGDVHTRPVLNGAPAKEWALTCGPCESHLRHDVHLWSTAPSSVPETPDEISYREEQEKRGMRDQANATAQALDNMGAMPDAFRQLAQALLQQQNATAPAGNFKTLCVNGHQMLLGVKFCSECGTSMQAMQTIDPSLSPSQVLDLDKIVSPSAAFQEAGQAAAIGLAAGLASGEASEGSPEASEDAPAPSAPVRRRRVANT